MKITGDWIDHPGTQALCAALEAGAFRALFVGGCVRNALYGLPVSDIDIATDAMPEKVSNIAQNAGFRVIPTGVDHGTVTVLAGGVAHEVTTFRQDVETDGRHAVVAFSDDIGADAARRDFTMNALYADRQGAVIDPLGGLSDLLARHVRFVGDPTARITEDYLRILRFFRFTAQYGDPDAGIDAEGLAACAANLAGIETLSRERIGAEMKKLLAAADPAPAVSAMAQSGVLAQILPGADPRPLAPLVHLEGDTAPDWLRRLAALGGEDAAERLRLSRAEARDLAALRDAIGSMESPAVLGWRLGERRGRDALLLRACVFEQPLGTLDMSEVARGAATAFPIKAADLAPLTGPALGASLKDLQARWLSSDLRLTRDQLLG
jgi:poly(A) polymerase